MNIRIRYNVIGNHVHCRVFAAKAANMTFARVGELTFARSEWNAVRDMLNSAVEFVPEHGIVALVAAPPMRNEAGTLCGLCDSTTLHEHPQLRCDACGETGLAENMREHGCAEKKA